MIKADNGSTAVKPTHTLRAESGSIEMKKEIVMSKSAQNDRAGNKKALMGAEDVQGLVNYEFDFNEIVYFLYGAIGALTTTNVGTVGAVYKHAITPANCLPSFTYEEAIGRVTDTANNLQNILVKRSYGVIVGKFVLRIEGGIVMAEVTFMAKGQFIQAKVQADVSAGSSVVITLDRAKGLTTDDTVNIYDTTPANETDAIASMSEVNKTITIATLGNSYQVADDAKVELTAQTPVYSEDPQIPTGAQSLVRFGADITAAATAEAGCIRSAILTIDNDPEMQECLGDYSKGAGGVVPKARTVTFEFTRSFKNKSDLDKYLQAKEFAIYLELSNGVRVNATDTGALKYKTVFKMPKCVINGMPIARDNNGIYEYTASVTALLDSTEGYDISSDTWNKLAGTAYTA